MGDKAEAKRLMQAAGVPVVPGYDGRRQGAKTLRKEADKLGYPLMIKAVAGGGGRGIRLVNAPEELEPAMESARREAASGFGDDRLMLERFFEAPRHVEFQVMADAHGHAVHLFERECSIQRRHQKIIEETPSPALTPELRATMGEAALFMEMNTRLQVEHPITEMTTGLDLVRLQIEIAEGRPLEARQEALRSTGHAIECRLNAEIPEQGFLPAVGRLAAFDFPEGPGLRVDTGFSEGAEIGTHYDSLLAKLVAWGATRDEALRRMSRLLAASMVAGVDTNLAFLQTVLALPAFKQGAYHTRLVEDRLAELVAPVTDPALTRERILAAAALDALLETGRAQPLSENGTEAASPWRVKRPWAAALHPEGALRREYLLDGRVCAVEIRLLPDSGRALNLKVVWEGVAHHAVLHPEGAHHGTLEVGEVSLPLRWGAQGAERWLALRGRHFRLRASNPDHGDGAETDAGLSLQKLLAPLPGKVIRMAVREGQAVAEHDLLAIVEAMKMEHQITAPYGGRVGRVHFKEGDPVDKDDLLLELEQE
jgi:3-methylcrotonyl-CoA carboxylase alpha subunit